ncbi:branched-chain amino acid ABC transporter permease [Sporanaerobacter acetigenes]|uniref:Amino acid/amide ABC transporter membrane protein 1, HAAT family n=1 Tax=Sporanaerobacter acetigenes DSM 13106 TaxID=1123281 RepID=A0A1M5W0Q5_9FIRM|nr:branched-chain amino acid ABC transporter permease [Sporanaerobacter acetigenes]SHH80753.1 amino acid/amide ABC transporter membrane protein 1, HAAT family [Sporanaerobacter acetigenes DSM 13106]
MSQVIVSGLITGSLYALAALGLVLIFKTSDIVNFAQGEMAMFNTFIAYTLMTKLGMPYLLAFVLTIIFAAIMGYLVQRIVIRPLFGSPLISSMIATLGLIMILNGLAGNLFGFETKNFPKMLNKNNIVIGSISIDPNSLLIILITIGIMFVLFYYFKYAMKGLAIRAVAQDPEAAKLMGISIDKVTMSTWMMSSILSAIAGMLIAPTTFLDINMMADVHLKSFSSAVLGGFNTFLGPVAGGFILGVVENLFGRYASLEWKTVFVFALIVIMLVVKPNGIFGKEYRKKV